MHSPDPDYDPIRNLSINDVIEGACAHFQVAKWWIVDKSRKKERVYVRRVAILIIRRHVKGTTLGTIAEAFNKVDHTSIIHYMDTARKLLKDDPQFKHDYEVMLGNLLLQKDEKMKQWKAGTTQIAQKMPLMRNSLYWLEMFDRGQADWKEAMVAITNLTKNCEEIQNTLKSCAIVHF